MAQIDERHGQFDYEFPADSTGAAEASWNPAFRKNSDALDEEEEDFFAGHSASTLNHDERQEMLDTTMPEENGSPIQTSRIAVKQEFDVAHEMATQYDLEDVPSHHADARGLLEKDSFDEDDDEALLRDQEMPILSPEVSAKEQEEMLEQQMPDDYLPDVEDDYQGDLEKIESPEEHYDHQGEMTEMEEAQDPSAEAPLLGDEQPLPTTSFASRASTMSIPRRQSSLGLEGAPEQISRATAAAPKLDRTFTTNFADSPIDSAPASSRNVPDDWPSIGDDRTFGELLDQNQESVDAQPREVPEAVAAQESEKLSAPDTDLDLLPEDDDEEIREADFAAAWEAALSDDELLEDTPTNFDPSQVFGEDEDGFLDDEPIPPPVQQQPEKSQSRQYRPTNLQPTPPQPQSQSQHQRHPSTLPSPSFFDQNTHSRSADTPSTGLHDIYSHQQRAFSYQAQPPQRPTTLQQQGHAQSFVDKSKGGYQSPYDLPMDVVKPRRRPQQAPQQQPTPAQTPGPPPVRSSSIGSSSGGPPPFSQLAGSAARPPPNTTPPNSRGSVASGGAPPPAPTSRSPVKPASGSGFFEELPMTTKPRARPAPAHHAPTMPNIPTLTSTQQGAPPRGSPHQSYQTAAGPLSPPRRQQSAYGQQSQTSPQRGVSMPRQAGQQYGVVAGLRQPERMPLLPDQSSAQQQQQPPVQQIPAVDARYSPQSNLAASAPPPAAPVPQSRYSPAPTVASQQPPPPATRYSPAPTAQLSQAKTRQPSAPALQQANQFAPRTSSPLAAFTDKPHPPLPGTDPTAPPRSIPLSSSPPKVNGIRRSPPESGLLARYGPSETRGIDHSQQFGPPLQRPQTQDPELSTTKARQTLRPGSDGVTSAPPLQPPASRPKGPVLPHRRQSSRQLTFAAPQDERNLDPLQRWKGHPIFKFNPSGTVLSSFPKHTPFYATGQAVPSLKCTPGSISLQEASHFMPMDERNAKFPGPLTARSKGRKKDVLAWMAGKIEDLEKAVEGARMDFGIEQELKTRGEEKVVLWRVMRMFVENDGSLEGKAGIEEEVRRVLVPNLAQMAQVSELQSPTGVLQRDAVDKSVTLQLRQALLEGQREKAVWLAEEKKLWGHAMLIASTMGPDTWKQIVQAFVRNQVKSFGSDARGLAALYHVFAGNSEECVDELVPPSARAGFQMISMASGGGMAGNPLEGLDQWRETLDLITSNRTSGDGASIVALGKLLAGYGRVEAAHTCYLFARAFVKHSGPDDGEAKFVLLGANHQAKDESFGNDLDSILLTEVYEYATSLSAPSTAGAYIPHLQAFKLLHAQELAAYGLKAKAQGYCDAITSAYTSTTKPSSYYHPTFTQAVAELNAFLSQTPHDGKAGLLSRPAMNKVSSSAASWFTKFVSGEDDQDSTGSGPGTAGSDGLGGPFGGVSGDSGDLSRSASGTDLYNPMMMGGAVPPPQAGTPQMHAAPNRYAPGAQSQASPMRYGPTSQQQPYSPALPPAEPQRAVSSRYAPPPSAGSSLGVPGSGLSRKASDQSLPYAPSSRRGSAQETSSQGSYEPRPILADEASAYSYSPVIHSPPSHSPAVGSPLVLAHQPPAVQAPMESFDSPDGIPDQQPLNPEDAEDDEETGGAYIPPSSGYEPPGYEPPSYSYQPYEPEPDSPVETKPKRGTMLDEDSDDAERERRAAAQKKAQADSEADELFRKAAEADAQRDKDKASGKKGWFGGWWGGKERDATSSPGPIKAKLGEENSFYYDENLKKWVNKKAGPEAATSVAATPPPPKGPASRVASAAMGPPSGPPSRTSSASGLANMARPPTSGSGVAPSSGPPSRSATPASEAGMPPPLAPPSLNGSGLNLPATNAVRPSSSLSNASSIDDLLAGPRKTAGGSGTVKKKKRYVDVMAK